MLTAEGFDVCCHLARPSERLALDLKLNQRLRRKNQLCLVCFSTDYKGLESCFYLPLWYGPNHGCQFSLLQLGSPPAVIFFLQTPSTEPDFCFSLLFHFHVPVGLCFYVSRGHVLSLNNRDPTNYIV